MSLIKKIIKKIKKSEGDDIFKSKELWDNQFRDGKWNYLGSQSQMGHYLTIIGCIAGLKKKPNILDAGCGQGILLKYLDPINFNEYLGIDFSSEAIKQAKDYENNQINFSVSKIETWKSDKIFDIIIFNESIYYLENPIETLLEYDNYLSEGGFFIISIYSYKNNYKIWKELKNNFKIEYEFHIPGEEMGWDVKVIRKLIL